MLRAFVLSLLLLFVGSAVKSQSQPVLRNKKDSVALNSKKLDTVKPKYINQGKVAGRQAMFRSMIVPGLGQFRNGFNVYRGLKVAGLYTGATLLTISFIDNSKNYREALSDLQYRRENPGQTKPGSFYAPYSEQGVIQAKDTFRRNKDVIIFSFIGLYLLNIVDAYVDTRLKYFDVGDVAFKVSPTLIDMNTNTMYGFASPAPGFKLSLSF